MDEDNIYIEDDTYQQNNAKNQQPFLKHDKVIHTEDQKQILTTSFLKKYIHYAKKQFQPILKDDSIEFISNVWTEMRQNQVKNDSDN